MEVDPMYLLPLSRRRRARAHHPMAWYALSVILGLLALLDLVALASLERVSAVLPLALWQPLASVLIVGLCLLPPLALQAATRATRRSAQVRPVLVVVPGGKPNAARRRAAWYRLVNGAG